MSSSRAVWARRVAVEWRPFAKDGDTVNQISEADWISIGFRFGLGFCLAAALISGTVTILSMAWISYEAGQAIKSVRLSTPRIQLPQLPTIPQRHTVHIPGRTSEECKAETGGILNEQYLRCTRGYDIQQ